MYIARIANLMEIMVDFKRTVLAISLELPFQRLAAAARLLALTLRLWHSVEQ